MPDSQGQTPAATPAMRNFAQLPLAFARSRSGGEDRYVARGRGYSISLDAARAAVEVTSGAAGKTVSLEFAGSQPGKLAAGPELPGKINIIQGNDPKQWQLGLSTYGRLSRANVYPGIDVVYYGNQQQLEFDLVVKPGANPDRIRLRVSGAEKLSIDTSGALDLGQGAGGMQVALPRIYQNVNGLRRNINGHYSVLGKDEVAFRVDPWDRTQPLVIDPTITLSTMFGGNGNTGGQGIQLDSNGNILIAGGTAASDFPVASAAQITLNGINGNSNAFVTKLNPTATSLIYSTYLGGSNGDQATAIAVDSTGSAWITGATQSADFPLLNAAQSTFSGGSAAFVTRLSSSGVLQFSTFLGSSGGGQGNGIAVDGSQNGYVAGYSTGTFPTTSGVVNTTNQSYDAFVTKYNSAGVVQYSTLLGGSDIDGAFAIAVDSTGAAYVTGLSLSSTFTGAPAGGAQTTNGGLGDVFVAKLSPDATSIAYFTFLGGTGSDEGNAIAVDSTFNAYISGETDSTGLATTGAAQTTLNGSSSGFVAKLNPTGSAFTYVTYMGGGRVDKLNGIVQDGSGNAYVTGQSDSNNFPTASAIQPTLAGNQVGLFSSSDSGATWAAIDSTLPAGTYDFSINPADTSAVALTESGVYRTTNGGTAWNLQTPRQSLVQNRFRGDWGSAFLSRSPANANTIYAVLCCNSVYKSIDDGMTWAATSNSPGFNSPLGIVADPLTAGTVYAFGNGFPNVAKSIDGGNTWNAAISGLPGNQVMAMAAGSDGSLYLDTQNGGLYKSTNHAGSWTALTGLSGTFTPNPFSLSVSGTTVYFVSSGNFYKSTNGGTTWTSSTAPGGGVGEVAASPQSPLVVYVYSYNNSVYASADGGATWSGPGTGFSASTYNSQELVVDPGNAAHVVVVSPVNQNAVVAKVKSDGSAFSWSTYLGGVYGAKGTAATTDGSGNAFVTGNAGGGGFPATVAGSASSGAFLTEISDATGDCSTLTVTPTSAVESEYGGQLNFSVVAPSGCTWTASTNAAWAIILSGASGTGSGTITIGSIVSNLNVNETATLTVGTQTVPLTQPSNSCGFSFNKTSYTVPQGGGTVTAILNAHSAFAPSCPWAMANNDPNAVTITSPVPAQGTGDTTITLAVAANPDLNPRSFSLPVGPITLNIFQFGLCTYQLSASSVNIAQAGGTGSVNITTSSQLCTWNAGTNNGNFLTISSGFSGTGNGTINYSVLADPTNPRTGTLAIAGLTFTVNQAGIVPGYLTSTVIGAKQPAVATAGASAIFGAVTSVATDSAGNAYMAVPQLGVVYRLDGSGTLTRFAGVSIPGFSGDGGTATSAQLSNPRGVAVDALGNVYIADSANQRVRKVTPAGIISTVAGIGIAGFASNGGTATDAELSNPTAVATDASGNLYIADTGNNRIRKVTGGVITSIAGNGTNGFAGDGGAPGSAQLSSPQGVAVDSSGKIYIADTGNNRIRIVAGTIITTIAGNNVCCNVNDGGPATSAWLAGPTGLAIDSSGNLLVADTNNARVREVTTNDDIYTVVGNGTNGFKGDGGSSVNAELRSPAGVAFDSSGNLLIADQYNQRVRKVSGGAVGTINTVLGGGANGDGGPVSFATLGIPGSVAQDGSGNFFIADTANNVVREISASGVVSTVAGTGVQGYSGDGAAATAAMLNQPQSVTVDTGGNLYIYDSGNDRIREVSGGNITTIAGNGTCCYSGDGSAATSAQINYGYGVAVDGSGNVYIADTNNHRIRKISGGTITTVAGTGSAGYSGDNGAATSAQLNNPYGVTVDAAGANIYIADSSNHRIRKVNGGTITTVAGTGSNGFSGDGGAATAAQINNPRGVALDGSGDLFIADSNNNRVREVLASGTIVTVAGNGGGNYTGDFGVSTSATFRTPQDVIVDATGNGNLYVADTFNSDIRLLTTSLPVIGMSSTHTGSFTAGSSGSYTLTVSNFSAAATSGTVTVNEILPPSLTLNSMSGTGWTCTGNSCTRSDALVRGTPYPAITVSVNVSGTAPSQVTNEATVSGGGAFATGAQDFTVVTPAAPSAPVLTAPANGATNVSLLPMLTWTAASEATSYAVYFGTTATPPFLANTTDLSFTPPLLTVGTTYFWQVVATNSVGTTPSAVFSFTTYANGFCTFTLTGQTVFGTAGGAGAVTVNTAPGCVWGVVSSQPWLAIASAPQGVGSGGVPFSVAPNTGAARSATLTIGGQTFTVNQTADYLVSTITGGQAPAVALPGTGAWISQPMGMATDSSGNTYIAMPNFSAVYRLDGSGTLSLFAGTGVAGFSGDTGPASSAKLSSPNGVAVDAAGDVFIADSGNQRIREVNTAGIITTVAGTGNCCFSGDGGQATSANLNFPTAVAVDSSNNLYISDTNDQRVRKVTGGIITTIAGNGTAGFSGDGATATSAQLNAPSGLAVDGSGNVYIADRNNNRVRKVSGGTITTVAGNNVCCSVNDGGLATNAWLASPQSVLLDPTGTQLYIADSNNNRIRLVAGGNIVTIAGVGPAGYSGDGGSATAAHLTFPVGIAFDPSGNLLIADTNNQRVRNVAGGIINTVIGGAPNGDGGSLPFATLSLPSAVAKDAAGNIYFPDFAGNRIRMISASGAISTFAGTGTAGFSGEGGPATAAMLNGPSAVALDGSGNLYLADNGNYRIRKISGGNITTIAGNGICCYSGDGGTATNAQINTVWGIWVDSAGSNVYIADSGNNRIRRISGGNINTVAGNGNNGFSGDGAGATLAQLSDPNGVALDSSGNIYIADSGNNRIRKVSGGNITTVAGTGVCCFAGDGGPATSAQLNFPRGVLTDGAGNIYIADTNDERIREVISGTILTVAGNGSNSYQGDGGPAGSASFRSPQNFTLDSAGNVYVADTYNNAIRELTRAGTAPVLTITSAHSGAFNANSTGSYTVTVSNAALAAATTGTVTVTEILPPGLTLGSMSGTGWTCPDNTCTRSNPLTGGASYPAITVSVNVGATAPLQLTNEVTVSGGGSNAAAGGDTTQVAPVTAPAAPVLTAPSDTATKVSILPALTWNASPEATSYAVYFGTTPTPPFAANTTALSYTPPLLALNTKYYWQVFATNIAGATPSAIFSFTTYGVGDCTYVLNPVGSSTVSYGSPAGAGSVTVTAPAGCVWTGASSQSFVNLTLGTTGSGNGTVNYTVAANTGGARSSTLTIAGQTITVNQGPAYLISTLTGGLPPAVVATATASSLATVAGIASDAAGYTYIAQPVLNSVYRRDASGVLTLFAGTGVGGYSGDSGPATSAMLDQPHGLAVDAFGNLYIADSGNNRIRQVTPAGIITTVAGSGNCCYSGDGAAATSAGMNYPTAVALDAAGNLYIADTNDNRIREVSGGIMMTIAGNGTYGYSGDGSTATNAMLGAPQGVAVDSAGNVYVADSNNGRVRKVSGGNINAFAGNGTCCMSGDGGPATSGYLAGPLGLAVDSQNNLYIADSNNQRIRKVSGGNISTVAGSGNFGFAGDGGAALSASLRTPAGIAFDPSGNLLIADQYNGRIRSVNGGNISTVAGGGSIGDGGPAPFASLGLPGAVAKDSSGNVYFADGTNNRIREISASGVVSTVAGTGVQGYSGDDAAATSAMLSNPTSLTLDSSGNLYIYDAGNFRIRKVDTGGNITTVAGNGTCCYSGDTGTATSAQINYGYGIAVDGSGNVYIADTNNQRIRKVSGGNITTVAGTGTYGYSGDNAAATSANLASPQGVAVDGSGNIFIADSNNNRVREVSGTNITTVAGNGTCCFSGDSGPATGAQLNAPRGVMVDAAGNLYIADNSNRIREVTSIGTIVTIAGNGGNRSRGDGGPALNANLFGPDGMWLDSTGDIYIADTYNAAIRVLTPVATSPVLTIASAHTGNFTAGGTGSYTLTVSNAAGAGTTTGTVTVNVKTSAGMTLSSLSGTSWSCTGSACTRSDPLSGGSPYPAIAMSVTTPSGAPFEVTNQALVSGGGSNASGASDNTIVAQPAATLTALSTNFVAVGGPAVAVTITGTGITPDSSVSFSVNSTTTSLPAQWLSATQVIVTLPAALLVATGNAQVAVVNPSGAISNSLPFTISTNTPQTITFGPLSNVVLGSVSSVAISATSDSGLAVTFTASTPVVCSVSGTTVTIIASGGCSITASQPGNTTYAPATPVTQKFTVTFGDVSAADPLYNEINAFAQAGITSGCGVDQFCPGAFVTRDEMAIFIVRAIFHGNDNFTYTTTPYFTDVTPTTFGFKWIQKLKDLGITSGCTATTYCPSEQVNRDQMAVFIIRARLGVSIAGPGPTFTYPTTPYFTDATAANEFAFPWIQRMKVEGITSGCTATTYCSTSPVTREQMATFIMRGAFNQFLPAGTPVVSQISPSTLAHGTSGTFTITGTNTNFVQGTTTLSPIPGVTIGTITVTSATSLTVQLTAASGAVTQPYSILAITGTEQAVLPNGLVIQ